jgi:hypothetical protein
MRRAESTAARTMSTETPSETIPYASGGLTCTSAASTGNRLDLRRWGISERKTGEKSARPSRTACRRFGPMKKVFARKRSSHPAAV